MKTLKEESFLKLRAQNYLANKPRKKLERLFGRAARRILKSGKPGKLLRASVKWEHWEHQLLDKYPNKEVARRTGRSIKAAEYQRWKLGLRTPNPLVRYWTPEEERLLGTMPDAEVSKLLKRGRYGVRYHRLRLRILERYHWSRADLRLLKRYSYKTVARRLGVSNDAARAAANRLRRRIAQ